MSGARREARVITTAVALLCGAAVVTPHFPAVEHVVNVAALVLAAVVVLVLLVVIVRNTWG